MTNVFVSYSRVDESQVREVYQYLKDNGCNPWLDVENLLPGQNWEYEIEIAMEAASAFVICLSSRSVDKVGYMHAELKDALDKMRNFPEGKSFIIPLRLDDCQMPRSLRKLNWLDWFDISRRPVLIKALTGASAAAVSLPANFYQLTALSEPEKDTLLKSLQSKNPQNLAADEATAFALILLERNKIPNAIALTHPLTQRPLPDTSHMYLNALARLGKKRPRDFTRAEALELQQLLMDAVDQDADYQLLYVLMAILRHDYFLGNGLRSSLPDIDACLNQVSFSPENGTGIKQILQLVDVPDSSFRTRLEAYV